MRAPVRDRSTSSPSLARRSGAVLLGVMVVLVVLALLAYQYSDRMTAEYLAANNAHRIAQARAFADAGVHYAAAVLSSEENLSAIGGNPYDNAAAFLNVALPNDGKGPGGLFSLVAPLDPDDTLVSSPFRAGVTDETGKINLNAMMKRDELGQTLYDMLVKLPNMTPDIAASIVDYLDADDEPREGGAENDYYSGVNPPYKAKNGPLDSLDELLLVKGVTRELLYGSDLDRDGLPDADANGVVDRGWAAFLTVWSREANRTGDGLRLFNFNTNNMTELYGIAPLVGDDVAKYMVMYRQYGPSNATGGQQSLGRSIAALFRPQSTSTSQPKIGNLADWQPKFTRTPIQKFSSIFDLVGSYVSIPDRDPKKPATVYLSPLTDVNRAKEVLTALFEAGTLTEDAEIPARVNITTAPREVLATLPELTEGDVQTILSVRPKPSSSEPPADVFRTLAWLYTDANLKPETLRKLESSITGRSQVFHVQSIGAFAEGKGPTARVEAVIDVNFGRPRILMWRDWTELGKTALTP